MATNESNSSGIKYHVRRMTEEDVPRVLQIWGSNGYSEGSHSIQSFMKVDPEGFVVAVEDGTDQVLGMCSGVFVNPYTGFIGIYAVDPKYHKRGIGISMWRKIMEHVGDRNVGLVAARAEIDTYRNKSGFKCEDRHSIIIYLAETLPVLTNDLVKSIDGIRVEVINESNADKVIKYDEEVHGYSRAALLPHVFKEKDSIALVAINENDGSVVGYGCFWTSSVAGRASSGPLYADSDSIAELIVYKIVENFPVIQSKGLVFRLINTNAGAIRIAEKLGLSKRAELPRLFTKFTYKEALWDKVYSIHSPNLSLL